MSRENERDRALSCQLTQPAELFGMLVDLRGVPAAKLRPTLRVVTKPFSQGCARRDILDPLIDRGVCFLDSTRPQAVDQYPGPVIGGGGFVGAFELDVIGRYSIGHRLAPKSLSGARFRQRLTFMHRNVIGLAAFDFILRIVLARVMSVSFVVNVFGMHLDDRAADVASFRIPGYVIADFEPFPHHASPIAI